MLSLKRTCLNATITNRSNSTRPKWRCHQRGHLLHYEGIPYYVIGVGVESWIGLVLAVRSRRVRSLKLFDSQFLAELAQIVILSLAFKERSCRRYWECTRFWGDGFAAVERMWARRAPLFLKDRSSRSLDRGSDAYGSVASVRAVV